jgi:ABC-type cobalamin/Fe3+-siderophores transport system ATPase subunit
VKLVFEGVSAGYTEVPAVHDVTLTIASGEFVAVVGPNGSGKSTLLKTVYRALRPRAGTVLLHDEDVWTARHRDVARRIGVLGQDQAGGYDFTAREAVRLGRYPHLGAFDRLSAADEKVAEVSHFSSPLPETFSHHQELKRSRRSRVWWVLPDQRLDAACVAAKGGALSPRECY